MLGLLFACNKKEPNIIKQDTDQKRVDYVSIDGLWKCTPETVLELENLTLEPVIKISGEISDK